MEEKREGRVLREALQKMRGMIAVFLILSAVNLSVFMLYGIDPEPFLYGEGLAVLLGTVVFLIRWGKERSRAEQRAHMLASPESEWKSLPEPDSLEAEDYEEMIRRLGSQVERQVLHFDAERQDMLDYYTTWVHQIKTPIAVMKLTLGAEDSPLTESLSAELFRIEQYVDMVLDYLRLGSESSDLVIAEYDLDELVRESIRKYAPQFIKRQLRLRFEPSGIRITTDKKWFACILEQILSNAVKYTPSGEVTVSCTNRILTITDTGIGIAPEDLPRIFEKGYTGNNGRMGMKSSGLGLYLCKKAADKLHIPVSCESQVGQGTAFRLDLKQEKLMF